MSVSVKDKLHKFALSAAAIICLVCALAFFNVRTVKADEPTSSPTTVFTEGYDYTADEVKALKTYYVGKIKALGNYDDIKSIDPDGKVQSLCDEMTSRLNDGEIPSAVAADYFSGDNGLAGAYAIFAITDEFYRKYIPPYADIEDTKYGLYSFDIKNVKKAAGNYSSLFALNDYVGNGTAFDVAAAQRASNDFDDTWFAAAIASRDALDAEYANVYASMMTFDAEIYFSEKYGEKYTLENVYGDVDADWRLMVENAVSEMRMRGKTADTRQRAVEAMNDAKREFGDLFASLKTVIARADEAAQLFDETEEPPVGQTKLDRLKTELDSIRASIETYNALPTLTLPIVSYDKNTHTNVTTELEIDLKKGWFPYGGNSGATADERCVGSLIRIYKSITREGIKEVYLSKTGLYGQSGENVVSKNKELAYSLIQSITENAVLGEPYTYDGKTVEDGADIIDAFADSYSVAGSLRYGGESSAAADEKYFVSSVSSKKEGKQKYVVTITYYVKDGDEFVEAPQFDADAFIRVREGATPSVERNTLKALKNPDKYCGDNVSDDDRNSLKGKGLWKYITLTVYEPDVNGAEVVKTDLKTVDGTTSYYLVSIVFDDDGITDKQAEDFTVIRYEHTTITDVMSNIEREGKTMKFKVNDVSNLLVWEWLTGDAKWDWAIWAAIGVLGLLVLCLVILIIVKSVRHKKYRIVFNARGGKYNTVVKVKSDVKSKTSQPFNYPKDPVRKGYVFMGWFADKKYKTRFAATTVDKHNVNVYAKWMKLSEYEKLGEQYSKAKAVIDPAVASADAQYFSSLQKDPQIEKIEAEKLSYMAKKAEEDRKTEEVKLQSIKEIEASKNNEEARLKAEKEADEARSALDSALKERDEIIAKARAEERSKCYGEVADSLKSDNASLAYVLANGGTAIAAQPVVAKPVNYEEELRKAREEAKAEAKKEFEEEMRRKAEEEARINAIVEARVKEIVGRTNNATEIANAGAQTPTADPAILERLAAAEEKLARYEEELAKRETAAVDEPTEEPAAEPVPEVVPLIAPVAEGKTEEQPAEEVKEEPVVNETTAKLYDRLKAEVASYVRCDDLTFGTTKIVNVLKITETDGKVELELNVPFEDLEEKGYDILRGKNLPSLFELETENDLDEGLELIEEAMSANGMMKSVPQVIYASTPEERTQGYEFVIKYDKVANNTDEYYALLRAYAGSFADVEGYDGEDKPLVKMFKDGKNVLVYLNIELTGLKKAEPFMEAQGYTSLVVVSTLSDCKRAMGYIEAEMRENGLIRYPAMTGFVEGGDDDGFAYVLKA